MLELYQAEWCPSSHRVRQRLTELGLDVILRQVPVERSRRLELLARTGVASIPVLVDGPVRVVGEDEIRGYLDRTFAEPPGALAQRRKAARIQRRQLAEAGCPPSLALGA
jgi:glutathione S-transferase